MRHYGLVEGQKGLISEYSHVFFYYKKPGKDAKQLENNKTYVHSLYN